MAMVHYAAISFPRFQPGCQKHPEVFDSYFNVRVSSIILSIIDTISAMRTVHSREKPHYKSEIEGLSWQTLVQSSKEES